MLWIILRWNNILDVKSKFNYTIEIKYRFVRNECTMKFMAIILIKMTNFFFEILKSSSILNINITLFVYFCT